MWVLKVDECQPGCRARGSAHVVHHLRVILPIRVIQGGVTNVVFAPGFLRGHVSLQAIGFRYSTGFVVEQCRLHSSCAQLLQCGASSFSNSLAMCVFDYFS